MLQVLRVDTAQVAILELQPADPLGNLGLIQGTVFVDRIFGAELFTALLGHRKLVVGFHRIYLFDALPSLEVLFQIFNRVFPLFAIMVRLFTIFSVRRVQFLQTKVTIDAARQTWPAIIQRRRQILGPNLTVTILGLPAASGHLLLPWDIRMGVGP